MNVELVRIDSVTPYARNPRRNEHAVDKVAASLAEFSWRQPIVVDENRVIIVGHTRYLAAQKLLMHEVPVHVATGLTPAQIKAYRLMDNRSHQDSRWDEELLGLEIEDLKGLDYDLSLTGFDLEELADFGPIEESHPDISSDFIPEPPAEPVTQLGDVWLLGAHRIVCGDVRDPQSWYKLLLAEKVQICVTSPPYWGLRNYNVNAQLGLEATPEEWTANLVGVFRRVRECLADDGTLWVNCGDSYSGGGGYSPEAPSNAQGNMRNGDRSRLFSSEKRKAAPGLKPKDLVGQPWRLAFALQADGWWLRQDIIWAKPNPMPESCEDRCTKSHEYLFLLSKSARYYFDNEAIKEPASVNKPWADSSNGGSKAEYIRADGGILGRPADEVGRNRRSVWQVATQPTPEAHFATYPCKLIEPAMLAGTSARGHCPACGRGWERVSEPTNEYAKLLATGKPTKKDVGDEHVYMKSTPAATRDYKTTDWRPGCECANEEKTPRLPERVPGIVLDPFLGAGTTMVVAEQTGRACRGIELNPAYVDIAIRRFEKLFGVQAALEGDGRTFNAVAGERLEKVA